MKKTLTLILTLSLALALCCPVLADNAHCFEPYPETVTITCGKSLATNANFMEGDTQADNYMTRAIKEELNIDYQLLWESDDYAQKIALSITAGDLPDMFVSPNYLTYLSLVENEMLADLSDAWATYASDFVQAACDSYNVKWTDALKTPDDKLYAIACPLYYWDSDPLVWIRQDWLDALGLTAPTTLDGFHDLLVAFKENYGSTLAFTNDVYSTARGLMHPLHSYPGTWIEGEDGKVVYGTMTDETKEAVKLLASWYQEGLIDPEFPTYDSATYYARFNAGDMGILLGPWWAPYNMGEFTQLEGADTVPYYTPEDENGIVNVMAEDTFGSMLLVSSGCEHPEAVVKMYSMQFEIYGIGGGTEYTAKYNDQTLETRKLNTSWGPLFPCGGVNCAMSDQLLVANFAIHDLEENGEFTRDDYTEWQKLVGTKTLAYRNGTLDPNDAEGWIFTKGAGMGLELWATGGDHVNLVPKAFSQKTESMTELWGSLQTHEDSGIMKMIVGEVDIDATWDSFVQDWYDQGGDIVTAEVNEICGK